MGDRPVIVGGMDRWPLWSPDMTVRSNGNASISADTSICAIADVDMSTTLQKGTDFGRHFLDTLFILFWCFFASLFLFFFDTFCFLQDVFLAFFFASFCVI